MGKVNKHILKQVEERTIDDCVKILKKEGMIVNIDIRKNAIKRWFMSAKPFPLNGSSYGNMLHALTFHTNVQKYRNGTVSIIFSSGVNLGKYSSPFSLSLQRYVYTDINNPSEYVIDSQWNDGIIALPKIFTHRTINGIRQKVSPYENENFYYVNESLKVNTESLYRHSFAQRIQHQIKKYNL